jgi:hypothetical protein
MKFTEIFDVDTLKVGGAWVVGTGNWMLQIDTLLHITVSVLSIVYIGLKIFEWVRKSK